VAEKALRQATGLGMPPPTPPALPLLGPEGGPALLRRRAKLRVKRLRWENWSGRSRRGWRSWEVGVVRNAPGRSTIRVRRKATRSKKWRGTSNGNATRSLGRTFARSIPDPSNVKAV